MIRVRWWDGLHKQVTGRLIQFVHGPNGSYGIVAMDVQHLDGRSQRFYRVEIERLQTDPPDKIL